MVGWTVGGGARGQLSNVIGGRSPVDAMPALLRLLDEGWPHDQTAAAHLAWMGGPAVPELARRLKDEKTSEAAAWGLVEKVCEPAALDQTVSQVVNSLMAGERSALAAQKRLLQQWEEQPLSAGVAASVEAFAAAYDRPTIFRVSGKE